MHIKKTIQTRGWQEILGIFDQEIEKMKKDFPYKDKNLTEVAKQYIARREAEKTIKKVLKKIEQYGSETIQKKESYK